MEQLEKKIQSLPTLELDIEMEDASAAGRAHGLHTPPPSPPTSLNDSSSQSPQNSIDSSPTAPSNEAIATPPPSPRDLKPPPQCYHQRHSGDCDALSRPFCSCCSLKAVLKDVTDTQIKARKTTMGTRSWNKAVGGRDKRHHLMLNFENGIVTSLRHCKKRLANEPLGIEQLTEQEERWDMMFSETSFNYEFSVCINLGRYGREFSDGKYTISEDDSRKFMHYRGRKQQIATDSDYPAEQDESKETVKIFVQTQAQERFTQKSKLPSVEEINAQAQRIASRLKRNRRSYGARVSFHPEVQVFDVRDVDVIRKTPRDSEKASHKLWLPNCGILRTTSTYSFHAGITYMTPKGPHDVLPVTDDPSRHKYTYKRIHPTKYQAGRWAPSLGSESVSTGGSNAKTWEG